MLVPPAVRQWLSPRSFPDPETTRRSRLLSRLLGLGVLLSLIGAASALADRRNDPRVTLVFYGVLWAWLAMVHSIARSGRVTLAAWIFSIFYWLMTAFVTLTFGGMQGQFASVFAVCTLMIGSIVGGAAALAMAVASAAWCALVALLEVRGRLPHQLAPYSPINSWAAAATTILLTAALLQVSLKSLRNAHGEAQRAANERDAALRRSIQGQKLELVGKLTSGIAHDLNNLLTVIVSVSDVLRRQSSGTSADLLDELDGAASRATLMTRQVLSLARVRTDESQVVDVAVVVGEMGKMLPRLLGRSHRFEVKAAPGCLVRASRVGIEQILLNLAVNARDAMPDGGQFTLELSRADGQVVLIASDTGFGMSPEVKARLFEPFFTTKSGGTGLGLATVRQLMDGYGGTISVDSEPGRGARFRLQFPAIATPVGVPATAASSPAGPSPAGRRPRVLLAEDDPTVQRSLIRLLEGAGFEVTAVEHGLAALQALEVAGDVQCVVSDIGMPQMDGEELARRLGESHPRLPLVLLSGNREPGDPFRPGSPRTFLMKPVSQAELVAAIGRVVAQGQRGSIP
ncbi:MAG TPA: ATP-binding protein [Polyangia bacterium]|nr:ATP-binding protein [Polyangia bacterium]